MASFVDQIEALTGMSLTTFVTVAVVAFSLVYILYSSFVPYRNPGPVYEPPKPISIGEITAEELSVYDGRDPDKPLLLVSAPQFIVIIPRLLTRNKMTCE